MTDSKDEPVLPKLHRDELLTKISNFVEEWATNSGVNTDDILSRAKLEIVANRVPRRLEDLRGCGVLENTHKIYGMRLLGIIEGYIVENKLEKYFSKPITQQHTLTAIKGTAEKSFLPTSHRDALLLRIKNFAAMSAKKARCTDILSESKMKMIANRVPRSLEELLDCELIPSTYRNYGKEIVAIVDAYVEENALQQYLYEYIKKSITNQNQSASTASKDIHMKSSGEASAGQETIILKIGGSSITNKADEETLNEEALDWFAKMISESIDPSFLSSDSLAAGKGRSSKTQFIVVHGAGSFGHHSAKRYGLRCGKTAFLEELGRLLHLDNPAKRQKTNDPNACITPEEKRYQMEGLSKTRQSVQKLNAATVNSLIKHGVNAVGISPGVSFHRLRAHGATGLPRGTRPSDYDLDCSPLGMQDLCESINETLRAGLVPVVHGDACLLYDGISAGILGGDTIVSDICTLWNETIYQTKPISQVIFITDVAGVFTSDPKDDKNAELIRSLKVNINTGEVEIESREDIGQKAKQGKADDLNVSGSSHAHDVTGGLKAKLGAAVTIVQSGVEVVISKVCSEATERFVRGDWLSIWDVEAGTLLSQQTTRVL